jgi:hypothetical protein
MKERMAVARARETNFLMSFDLKNLNKKLLILLSVLAALNFFDAATTLVALNAGPIFVEQNPIAAALFRLSFVGFLGALALKYVPMVPLAYATFVRIREDKGVHLRVVKVSALLALAAADVMYVFIVSSNTLNLILYL